MSARDDALVRLGLALYRETLKSGLEFYSVQQLVFEHLGREEPKGLFRRLFSDEKFDFWKQQEELAKGLAQAGIAFHHSKLADGDNYFRDHFLKLTAFGRTMYDLAHSQSDGGQPEIEGMSVEDVLTALKDETSAYELARELSELGPKIEALRLGNFQQATVSSYITVLVALAKTPSYSGWFSTASTNLPALLRSSWL